MDQALRHALEAELEAIRADPLGAVGFGEKAYLPYSTTTGQGLISAPDPEVTSMLGDAIDDADDPIVALALLHIIGQRSDDRVDDILLQALDAPPLSPTAAYLLGRVGYRGYPDRERDETIVIGALVRLLGAERFTGIDDRQAPMIGLALPDFADAQRAHLLRQLARPD